MAVDYKESAAKIVELVGGNDNIKSVTHCITRVRFFLKDQEIAHNNTEAVSEVPGVIQVVEAGGQYQVCIGTTVEKMYDEVVALTGKGTGAVDADDDDAPAEKMSPMDAALKFMSGVMMPLLPAIIGCGLVSSLVSILTLTGLVQSGDETYQVLNGLGQVAMFFMPVLAGFFTAKHLKYDEAVGALLGGALAYPALANPELVGQTLHLFGIIPVAVQAYTSTLFPAMAAAGLGSVVYKWLKKHLPSAVTFFMTPFLTVLITAPIALAAIGPVINVLSSMVTNVILGLYNFSPIICGAVLGATWMSFVVPMGIHMPIAMLLVNNIITQGSDPVMGLLCNNMTSVGVAMAVYFLSKKESTKELALSSSITGFFGINEPALYGICLQHKETLAAMALGGAISGIVPALFNTKVYTFGASGVFALPIYLGPNGDVHSMIGAALGMLTSFVACFLITRFWPGFDPDAK